MTTHHRHDGNTGPHNATPAAATEPDAITQSASLSGLLTAIRDRFSHACQIHLSTTDQCLGYGFRIDDVTDAAGRSLVDDGAVDQLNDDLLAHLDLDWDSEVGEDRHGYATVDLI
jgi:hypothetical protein